MFALLFAANDAAVALMLHSDSLMRAHYKRDMHVISCWTDMARNVVTQHDFSCAKIHGQIASCLSNNTSDDGRMFGL